MISVTIASSATPDTYAYVQLTIGGVVIGPQYVTSRGSTVHATLTAIVPDGAVYRADTSGTLTRWGELR
jgi:hypothetical protein